MMHFHYATALTVDNMPIGYTIPRVKVAVKYLQDPRAARDTKINSVHDHFVMLRPEPVFSLGNIWIL